LAIYGAIIAAIICVIVFCKVKKINTMAFLDLGCYGVIIGQIVGRWGNFVNVEAYGGVTDAPWRMSAERIANRLMSNGYLESQDVYNAILNGDLGVHPTFFYESFWNLIGLGLLILIAKKWRKVDGQIFLSYIIWYGAGRAVIEGMRTDSLYFFNTGIRTSQVLGILSAAAGIVWLLWRLKHCGPHTNPFVAPRKGEERPVETQGVEKTPKEKETSEEEKENGCDQT
jgi:phosphatidylglycerol:prolipoprotein diacylglycerol transferase